MLSDFMFNTPVEMAHVPCSYYRNSRCTCRKSLGTSSRVRAAAAQVMWLRPCLATYSRDLLDCHDVLDIAKECE